MQQRLAAFEDAAYIGFNCSLGGGVIYRPTITADRVFGVSVDVDFRPGNSGPQIILFSTIFRLKDFRLDRSSVTIAPAVPPPGSVPAPRTILLLSIAFLSLPFARAMHDRGRGDARRGA